MKTTGISFANALMVKDITKLRKTNVTEIVTELHEKRIRSPVFSPVGLYVKSSGIWEMVKAHIIVWKTCFLKKYFTV